MKLYEYPVEYERLLAQVDDDGVLSEESVQELALLESDAQEKGLAVASYFQNIDAEVKAMKQAEEAMARRREGRERERDRLKNYLKTNMERLGITKITSPQLEVSIRRNPAAVIVDDEDELLKIEDFVRVVPEKLTLDKQAIKAAIEAGNDVDGAHLERGTRLNIR